MLSLQLVALLLILGVTSHQTSGGGGDGEHPDGGGTCGSQPSLSRGKCGNAEEEEEDEKRSRYSAPTNRWSSYLQLIRSAADQGEPECGLDDNACSTCHLEVIQRDLAGFGGAIDRRALSAAANVSSVTKYQIIDHKLYRSEYCMFPFRCRGIEHFLLEVAGELPDTEFYVNTRDWPMVDKYFSEPLPVFSFSKTNLHWDIMYPAWTFWEGGPALSIYPNGLGRWDKKIVELGEAAAKYPWHTKISKAFFRGSRTSSERDPLVLLSRQSPDLVDAAYTKNQAWKSDADTLGQPAAFEVKLQDHCRYKYLFNYRGVAASFRFKHLFLCRSLVLHVGSDWEEFFYPALRPWLHYVPVEATADQAELRSLLEFVQAHDAEMSEIGARGASFVEKHLTMATVSCYWKALLLQYTSLLQFTVESDSRLIRIK